MSQPTAFDRQTSFTLFSSEFPDTPHSGADLDVEFNAVKLTLDETLANLALIQDDDGALARGSVGQAQLDSSISLGFSAPEAWTTGGVYDADTSTVFYQSRFYLANVTHTAGASFEPAKWDEIADFTVANTIDDGSLTTAKYADLSVTAGKLGAASVVSSKLGTASVTETKIGDLAVTTDKLNDLAVTEAKLAAAIVERLIPAGTVVDYAGASAPSGWLMCYGQSVLRATYPALFTAIGTAFGTVDGTHFTMPDLRGRVTAGGDAMGGVSADRLTNSDDGLNGDLLGATGGVETQVLVTSNLPPYTPAGGNSTPTVTNGSAVITSNGTGPFATPAGGANWGPLNGAALSLSGAPVFTGTAQGGSSTAFGVVQPTLILNKIIKAH
jgi:microcystin-dependent protein